MAYHSRSDKNTKDGRHTWSFRTFQETTLVGTQQIPTGREYKVCTLEDCSERLYIDTKNA